ncbi:MAG: Calx-beta domain-containing protein [Acidobacteriota bacterium]
MTSTPSKIAFSSPDYCVRYSTKAASTVTVAVNRLENLTEAVTADYTITDQTAVAGTDYAPLPTGTLSFAALETTKTFDVSILHRVRSRENKVAILELSNAAPVGKCELGSPQKAALIISPPKISMPPRVHLAIGLVALGVVGLALIFWIAAKSPLHLDGKTVVATTDSTVDHQCTRIRASFDKEKVLIFTEDAPLRLRDDLVIQPHSFITTVLANRTIDNRECIPVLETQHNAFLCLNVVRTDCPE